MAKIKVDFSDVQSFEALEDGEYNVVIESAVLRESKNSEYPYINLQFAVADGEYEGRKLWAMLSLHPKALWRTKENFENLGFDAEEIDIEVDDEENDNGDNDVLEPQFVGLACVAVVTTETYEGKLRNRVETLLPAKDEVTKKKAEGKGGKKETAAKKPAGKAAGGKKKFA